ncbi:type VI secretion system baseplate subunit TssE [Paraherbaspirillum soli]|uniref:Type VI secretion system baseplate subunit TssE n=1 Tax=Paraherbaspirillum soli TaxID=631222 RepID=A0ABW0M2V0_9BURK
MSRPGQRQRHIYLPTLIDRLQDDAPNRLTERPQEYAFDVRGMRAIVQRDLALLLNTTNLSDQIDEQRFPAATASVLNYGVPTLSGSYVADRKWEQIAALIKKAILDFEPRLIPESLTVTPLNDARNPSRYNILMFELNGLVHWSPYPLEFRIQSAFDLENASINLQQV